MTKLTQQEAIDTIKKLYRIKENCPLINSNGAWNNDVLNAYGALQLNNYVLHQLEYPYIWGFKKTIGREFGCTGNNANVLKHKYEENQKECLLDLWEEILFHHGTDYSIEGKRGKINSPHIQGIMFIELCQSEALPYSLIIDMAKTLKKRRIAVYRLYRILNAIKARKMVEKCTKHMHEIIMKSIKNH